MEIRGIYKRFLLTLFTVNFIHENGASPANKLQNDLPIIFPAVEKYDECFVDDLRQVKGTCKTLADCGKAVERWDKQDIVPKTCYFDKFEQFVCCENEFRNLTTTKTTTIPPEALETKRRSELECQWFYSTGIILHIDPDDSDYFPFIAAIGWRSYGSNLTIFRCAGALISNKFVLTAAHCIDLGGEPPYVVRLGGVNLTEPYVDDIKIKSITVHPEYNATSAYNDIALIELEKVALVDPACIWTEEELQQNNIIAVNYRYRKPEHSPPQLLRAQLVLISNEICQRHYKPGTYLLRNGVASTHVCAGDPKGLGNACLGVFGGSLIMKVQRYHQWVPYVIGITSIGQGCAGGPPSIYTRISSFADWIESIVWPPLKNKEIRDINI